MAPESGCIGTNMTISSKIYLILGNLLHHFHSKKKQQLNTRLRCTLSILPKLCTSFTLSQVFRPRERANVATQLKCIKESVENKREYSLTWKGPLLQIQHVCTVCNRWTNGDRGLRLLVYETSIFIGHLVPAHFYLYLSFTLYQDCKN